jgi:hypothetical protein
MHAFVLICSAFCLVQLGFGDWSLLMLWCETVLLACFSCKSKVQLMIMWLI